MMADKIREMFENPSSEYRTAPFWSWNGVMEEKEISFHMKDMKAHGMGGAFAHPRIGMITEYLSGEFFAAWRAALECARSEGMKLYMYDENAWPSGFAGGKTVREDASTVGELAEYKIMKADAPEVGGKVFFAAEYLGDKLGREVTDLPAEQWKDELPGKEVLAVYSVRPKDSAWTAGYPYPDVTNPRTVEIFLRNTYEEYAKRFGADFGDLIPAVFSDEANIHSEGLNTLPFAPHIRETFERMHGYPLMRNLPAVFLNLEGGFDRPAEKVRYDYFTTLHEVWIENFVKPIASWCDEHGIAWTGHDVEHQWPQAHHGRISVSEQTTYEFRQWPALDLLMCEDLRHTPTNYEKFQMYEIRSAANQFGKKRTLCEAYGAGGYDSTLEDYKRLSDFLLVNGINFICQHLSLYSYLGARKRDCPQSFDYRQPWWNEYTEQADYLARASFMTAQGAMKQRLLLLNPSTTGYLVPPEEAEGTIDHAATIDRIKNPDMRDFLRIVDLLADGQWDFDVGDEYSLERNARIEDGRMMVGLQAYETVLVSRNMRNMRSATVRLLEEFIRAGGNVLVTGEPAEYIEGSRDAEKTECIRALWTKFSSPEDLMAAVAGLHEAVMSADVPFPTGFASMRRILPDGRVMWFMVNHAMEPFEATLTVAGECAAEWDLFTGRTMNLNCQAKDGKISFPVSLSRCESLCIVVGDRAEEKRKAVPNAEKQLNPVGIRRETMNTFTLDHVSLEADGTVYPPRYFIETGNNLFSLRGFDGNPWKSTTQPGTAYMDKNAEYGEGSGFKAHYAFIVRDVPEICRAVVERPEVMHVSVNGHEVAWSGEQGFLDHGTGVYDVARFLKTGENVITLWVDRFDVLCEIEAIFLQGVFSVEVEDNRFVMTKEMPVSMGSWLDMGMTFYPGAMIYRYETELDGVPEAAEIELGKVECTAASVTVNGEYACMIGRNGGSRAEIGGWLKQGKNVVEVRVCGSYRNLMGPYLNNRSTEPYEWRYFIHGREAGADEYMLCPYGLYEHPRLRVTE